MKRKLLIYSRSSADMGLSQWPDRYIGYKLIRYTPGLTTLNLYGLNRFVNLFWLIFGLGKSRVLILLDKQTVVHYSYITPKVFRFPFMKKGDVQVGPCVTHKSYRGQGIFSKVLDLIPSLYPGNYIIWTYTTEDDIAAQKAFKNAGYSFISFAEMSLKTKIVRILN